nr:patatin-like phospholipase family protein [Cellulomonas dongxiuzhuiae]
MKGGIASGVIYPRALAELAATYRFRGLGGASAGAIGAALGAAAEFGRKSDGFVHLDRLPDELKDGGLARMFQAQPRTRPLLDLMLTATTPPPVTDPPDPSSAPSARKSSRVPRLLWSVVRAFPVATLLGLAPGLALVVVGTLNLGLTGWLLIGAGLLLAAIGWAAAVGVRAIGLLTQAVPENLFGICRGLGVDGEPGLTDWLAEKIETLAGIPPGGEPLTFGNLWTGQTVSTWCPAADRKVDLRMISTCLSQARPYEMPWDARTFFYDPEVWATLFPPHVMAALEKYGATPTQLDLDDPGDDIDIPQWQWEEQVALNHNPKLRRLPAAKHLPVIVATRLSLSFPLLISAIPLWTIEWSSEASCAAREAFRAARKARTDAPERGLEFVKLWFSDGGLCSNFPIYLFDSPLPARPTLAINLGNLPPRQDEPALEQRGNIVYADDNYDGMRATNAKMPERGFAAVGAFASGAFNTARNWQDSSYVTAPGYRDRIVRILQSKAEGGMNLRMPNRLIDRLAERGKVAAAIMAERFTKPVVDLKGANAWENHYRVRLRALLATLPDWLNAYARGRQARPTKQATSYAIDDAATQDLADVLSAALDRAAQAVADAGPKAATKLASAPSRAGSLRRIPPI